MSDSIQKHDNGHNRNENHYEHLPTITMSQNEKSDNNVLDPQKIIAILLRHKWLVLFFLILGGSGAWYYADHVTPIYESKGTLLISASSSSAEGELSQIIAQTTGVGTSSTLANEKQVLQSREFSRHVARKLIEDDPGGIDEFPILWSKNEEGEIFRSSDEVVASRIRSNLGLEQLERDAEVIEMSFKSPSPREAATVLNGAMQIYVERSTLSNRQAAESTAEFLESERADVKQKLEESEQRLKKYMDTTGIVRVDEQASGAVSQRAEIELELERVKIELETIQQAMNNHERQLERIKPGLSEQFSEAIGPRIRNSQEQLALYERERTMILTRNPGVRDREVTPARLKYLDEEIDRMKSEIRELSDKLFTEDDEYMGMDSEERAQMIATIQTRMTELRIEKNQNESRKQALEQRKQELDTDFDSLPEGMIELARLQRDVKINEELYVNISRQYADMSVWKQSQFGFGRIIDLGDVPNSPISPNEKLFLLLGLMLGGVLATGLILTKEFLDKSINSVDQIRSLHFPMLAAIPSFENIPKKKKKTFKNGNGKVPDGLVLLQDRSSLASESILRLKNNIIYQYGDMPPKTLAVTSPEKGDGKSTIVSNLGIAFAEEGFKTLVIDTDFRRPKLHEYFGLPGKPGLTDYLSGNLPIQELIRDSELANLKVITAGKETQRPENIANSKEFKHFLAKMVEVFDLIILDTPPFGVISDSASILKNAEATLLVTKYRKTNRAVFFKSIEELERIHAKVNGIVLNDFDHRKETGSHYGPGYYEALYSNYEAYVK